MSTPAERILLVTTPTVGHLPHQVLGAVMGDSATPRYHHTFTDAYQHATRRLRAAAAELDADAVVGITVGITFEHHAVLLLGTAIRLPWPDGTASPDLYDQHAPSVSRTP